MLTAAERRALKGKAHKLEPVGKVFVIYRKNP